MTLVDSNVLLDVLTGDAKWGPWSEDALIETAQDRLGVNPLIYAELSPAFRSESELENALSGWAFERWPLPYEAAFSAGQAFLAYRRRGGVKRSPLPDFYIGAHALTSGLSLLTRDPTRYRSYFPGVRLICPTD